MPLLKIVPPGTFVPSNPPEWRPLYKSKDGLFAHNRHSHIICMYNVHTHNCRHNVLQFIIYTPIWSLYDLGLLGLTIIYYALCVLRVPIHFTSIHILPVFIFPFKPAISRTYIYRACVCVCVCV